MKNAPLLVVLGALVGIWFLQPALGEANAERRRNDFRYTPDRAVARALSFGHRSTLADAIWLRALPDFAREFEDKELKERWLNGVFDVVTDLEPTFYSAYSFGSTYLWLINRKGDSAITLLERGVAEFDRLEAQDGEQYAAQTRLLIDTAMAYWMIRKDRVKTLSYLDRAIERPDCDNLTRNMRIGLALQDRDDLLALTYAAKLLDHQNPDVREKAHLDYEFTKRSIARRAVREFEEKHGHRATSIEELADDTDLAPEVKDLVFKSVELDAEGMAQSPRYEELHVEEILRTVRWAVVIYHRDHGTWPPVAWLYGKTEEKNGLFVISRNPRSDNALPPGKTIAIDDEGNVTLVDE